MTESEFPFILPPDDDDLPPEAAISFQSESIDFELPQPAEMVDWIRAIILREECRLLALQYIFCNDVYLYRINLEYLDHDTLTDIITFPYSPPPVIHGDLFISIDRVRDNAAQFQLDFEDELRRVMIHGVLHLCGYGDKTPEEQVTMKRKEDQALRLFPTH